MPRRSASKKNRLGSARRCRTLVPQRLDERRMMAGDVAGPAPPPPPINPVEWIRMLAFENSDDATAARARDPYQDLIVVKQVDRASAELFDAALNESNSDGPEIRFVANPRSAHYFTITLSDVVISGYQNNSAGDADKIELNFKDIQFKYEPPTPPGR